MKTKRIYKRTRRNIKSRTKLSGKRLGRKKLSGKRLGRKKLSGKRLRRKKRSRKIKKNTQKVRHKGKTHSDYMRIVHGGGMDDSNIGLEGFEIELPEDAAAEVKKEDAAAERKLPESLVKFLGSQMEITPAEVEENAKRVNDVLKEAFPGEVSTSPDEQRIHKAKLDDLIQQDPILAEVANAPFDKTRLEEAITQLPAAINRNKENVNAINSIVMREGGAWAAAARKDLCPAAAGGGATQRGGGILPLSVQRLSTLLTDVTNDRLKVFGPIVSMVTKTVLKAGISSVPGALPLIDLLGELTSVKDAWSNIFGGQIATVITAVQDTKDNAIDQAYKDNCERCAQGLQGFLQADDDLNADEIDGDDVEGRLEKMNIKYRRLKDWYEPLAKKKNEEDKAEAVRKGTDAKATAADKAGEELSGRVVDTGART